MARSLSSVCHFCRRENTKLFLKGQKCTSDKCVFQKKAYPPGEHGRRRGKPSDYSLQLREKQKARRVYGLREKQFRNYFRRAERQKGITGTNLVFLLERRLDNIVYRLGLAASRREARQLVGHGHFLVNQRKVDIPAYLTRVGDVIEVAAKSKQLDKIKAVVEAKADAPRFSWLSYQPGELKGEVLASPIREELELPFQEQLIVELYSK